jgi:hypothetical protein
VGKWTEECAVVNAKRCPRQASRCVGELERSTHLQPRAAVPFAARSISMTPATACVRRLIRHWAGSCTAGASARWRPCLPVRFANACCQERVPQALEPVQLARQRQGQHPAAFLLPGARHGEAGTQWLVGIDPTSSRQALRFLEQHLASKCATQSSCSQSSRSMNTTVFLLLRPLAIWRQWGIVDSLVRPKKPLSHHAI